MQTESGKEGGIKDSEESATESGGKSGLKECNGFSQSSNNKGNKRARTLSPQAQVQSSSSSSSYHPISSSSPSAASTATASAPQAQVQAPSSLSALMPSHPQILTHQNRPKKAKVMEEDASGLGRIVLAEGEEIEAVLERDDAYEEEQDLLNSFGTIAEQVIVKKDWTQDCFEYHFIVDIDRHIAELTNASIRVVRETMVTQKKSSTGSGRWQTRQSDDICLEIPSRECGMELLQGHGTMTSTSSRMYKVTLTNEELRTMLPNFPFLVKGCATNGPFYFIRGGVHTGVHYAFVDAVVDSAIVKIKDTSFTIQFKSRVADEIDAVVEKEEEVIRNSSGKEWDKMIVLKDNLIQCYRLCDSSDIRGHQGLLCFCYNCGNY